MRPLTIQCKNFGRRKGCQEVCKYKEVLRLTARERTLPVAFDEFPFICSIRWVRYCVRVVSFLGKEKYYNLQPKTRSTTWESEGLARQQCAKAGCVGN